MPDSETDVRQAGIAADIMRLEHEIQDDARKGIKALEDHIRDSEERVRQGRFIQSSAPKVTVTESAPPVEATPEPVAPAESPPAASVPESAAPVAETPPSA